MNNFIYNLKADLEKTLSDLGHSILNLRIMKLVKENGTYQVPGTCDIFGFDMFGSAKILDFDATYDHINEKSLRLN
jgi:hypothetical protein